MALSQLTPAQIQQGLTTAYNANAPVPVNTAQGSALGAVFNAVDALAIQIQQQIAYVNTVSRLQTSSGPDVDSFVYPFGITRNAAVAAIGTITFSCNSPAVAQLLIGNGTTIQTASGTQFTVVADNSQTGYNAGLNGYVIPINGTSVNATVQAVVPGSSGNVQASQINQIIGVPGYPAPTGVNNVINNAAFTNGSDAESDSALTQRFYSTMASRWATVPALQAAIPLAQGGLTFQIGDMLDQWGNPKPNFFSVIVNVLGQNSGPPQAVLNAVTTAVLNNRPCGMPFTVVAPVLVPVNISATLTLAAGANSSAVTTAANLALANYINYIGLSPSGASTTVQDAQTLVVLKGVQGVSNVTGLTLNGGTTDVSVGYGSQLVLGTCSYSFQ